MTLTKSLATPLLALAVVASFASIPAVAQQPSTFTVYASGLQGPRGLTFGADGYLYVAEAGTGGTHSSGTACKQVVPPIGPYTGGMTARVSKISSNGTRTTFASGLPSTVDSMNDFIGAADVAFADGSLYVLVAGGGCSHGNPDFANGVYRINNETGKWNLVADLSAYVKAHPAMYESAGDFEPDEVPYSMITVGTTLYVVAPNHGQVFSITSPNERRGTIAQLIDISASDGHIVPTAIAERDGTFYVGNLNLFPIDPQWARVLTVAKGAISGNFAPGFNNNGSGYHIVTSKAGFTTVVAVHFGPDGLLYALEFSDAAGFPTPGMGKVVRVKSSGVIEDVVTGLAVPTGMTFGPDGRLYVSNLGAAPAGAGQILAFDIAPGH
jgi:hypothetical protein